MSSVSSSVGGWPSGTSISGFFVRSALWSVPVPDERRQKLIDDYKAHFANPYSAAERGYIDDVIEPRQTRPKLIRALRTLQTKRVEQPKRKHGNIPL